MRASTSELGQRFQGGLRFVRRRGRLTAPGRPGAIRALVVVLAMLALLAPAPGRVAAEEPGEAGIPVGDFRLLEPIQDALGGSSWLMAQGYDPRVGMGSVERDAGVGMDWGAYAAPAGGGSRAGAAYAPLVPARSAAPAFSRNQIVTRQVGLFPIQTEPHIAVNPQDPEHLVLGVIDYNFPAMSSYVSFDGGETWDGPNQVRYFQEDFTAAGDPVVGFDRDGNVYIVSISLGFEEFRLGSLVSFTEISSMVVSKSTDDGLTWGDAVSAARSTVESESIPDETGRERGTITAQFLDKPWLAVGPDPDDPDKDILYLSYTEFATSYTTIYADELPFLTAPATETTIRMVKSEDGGATWSEPLAVSPTVLQAEGAGEEPGEEGERGGQGSSLTDEDDDGEGGGQTQEEDGVTGEANQTVQGSQPKVMADGTLVVSYLDTTNDGVQEGLATIMVAISDDGGETFNDPVQAGVVKELHFNPRSSTFRYWGAAFPQLAVGPDEQIYVAASALPPTNRPTTATFTSSARSTRERPGRNRSASTRTTPPASSSSRRFLSPPMGRCTRCGVTCGMTRTRPATTSTTPDRSIRGRPLASRSQSRVCGCPTPVLPTSRPTPCAASQADVSSATTSPWPPPTRTSTWSGPIRALANSAARTSRSVSLGRRRLPHPSCS